LGVYIKFIITRAYGINYKGIAGGWRHCKCKKWTEISHCWHRIIDGDGKCSQKSFKHVNILTTLLDVYIIVQKHFIVGLIKYPKEVKFA